MFIYKLDIHNECQGIINFDTEFGISEHYSGARMYSYNDFMSHGNLERPSIRD